VSLHNSCVVQRLGVPDEHIRPSGSRCWSPRSTPVIAFPMRSAWPSSPRRPPTDLVIAVLKPLWAVVPGHGVRVADHACPATGSPETGCWLRRASSPGYGLADVVITLAYLWLRTMILPIYAVLSARRDPRCRVRRHRGAAPAHLQVGGADAGLPGGGGRSTHLPLSPETTSR